MRSTTLLQSITSMLPSIHACSHSDSGGSLSADALAFAAAVLARTPALDDSHQPLTSHVRQVAHEPNAEQSFGRRDSERGAG